MRKFVIFRKYLILILLLPFLFIKCALTDKNSSIILREAVLTFPEEKSVRVSLTPTLGWESESEAIFDVYLDTNKEPKKLYASNLENSFFEIDTELEYGTTYYWKVLSKSDGGVNNSVVNSFTTIEDSDRVQGIDLDKTIIDIFIGDSDQVVANVTPKNSKNQQIKWKSSNTKVAIISDIEVSGTSEKGDVSNPQINFSLISTVTIVGSGIGTTVVTATSVDGSFQKEVTVNVKSKEQPVKGVDIKADDFSVVIAKPVQLVASIFPSDADNNIILWNVFPSDRATISPSGILVGKTTGQVLVQAITDDGSYKDSVTVTFLPPVIEAKELTVDKKKVTVLVAGREIITARVSPDNATSQNIIWQSGDDSLVGVQNGVITGRRETNGKPTFVIARLDDFSDIELIEVEVISSPIPITDITFERPRITLVRGRSALIVPRITPFNATSTTISWATSDPTIVEPKNQNGNIIANKVGKANIIITASSGLTRSVPVDVIATDPQRTEIDNLNPNEKHQFTYENKLYYIINRNLTWADATAFARRISSETNEYVHLVHINDSNEYNEIVSQIKNATNPNNSDQMIIDVIGIGNKSTERFLWTGGSDSETESTWVWDGDGDVNTQNASIGTGEGFSGTGTWSSGNPDNNFWGKSPSGQQLEPDNGKSENSAPDQDGLGIGIDNSLRGDAYQWFDLSVGDRYPFILEIE